MSLEKVIRYINSKVEGHDVTVGQMYGTENFCHLLYSLVKMEQPDTIIELGVGAGATTCMMAQAVKENNKGFVFAIDNGDQWKEMKIPLQKILGESLADESYENFLHKLLEKLELEKYVHFKNITLTNKQFFDPKKPVDLLFFDAHDSGPLGCISLLHYYLPKMNKYSSIFIDRASTIHHAYLVLEQIIKHFQNKAIPECLLSALDDKEIKNLRHIVSTSKFTLIHLTETGKAKINKTQNSTAWIKIEPIDLYHHNHVETFV